MIEEDAKLAGGWMGFERFVALLQGSVRQADQILLREAEGDIHFAVTELSVSAPVELGVEAESERPMVRIPRLDELAQSGAQVARITFTLRPVPLAVERPQPVDSGAELASDLSSLREALVDTDYRDRVRALRRLRALGVEAEPLRPLVRRMAEEDRSTLVQEEAKLTLDAIGREAPRSPRPP